MHEDFMQELDSLRNLSREELNEDQLAFLRARRSYLTEEELVRFGISEDESDAMEGDGLDAMKVPDLLKLASEHQLVVPEKAKKAQLIEILRAAGITAPASDESDAQNV